jgi:signal transduction histidine kinase
VCRDTGPGVESEKKLKIFDPFFGERESGTGLGLAIVKSIIDKHQGAVEERGEFGEGAIFEITLPLG